jgi:hypothetical protein
VTTSEVFGRIARSFHPCLEDSAVNPEDVGFAKIFYRCRYHSGQNHRGRSGRDDRRRKIRVINTFEKRLERAWVDMLPELIKNIYDVVEESP